MNFANLFQKELIKLNAEFSSTDEMFEALSNDLIENGYAETSFKQAIIEREKEFPTGLSTETEQLAIPHTDTKHIKKPFIYIVKLNQPLRFLQMATTDTWLDINIIFMLGIKEPSKQVGLLSLIIDKFKDEQFVNMFNSISTEEEMLAILQKQFRSEDE